MHYSGFKNKLASTIKKQKKRGSPTVEESVGHIPIPQMFDELDKCMDLMAQTVEDYKSFRNGGVKAGIVKTQVALLSIKKFTTLYRRYLAYIRMQIPTHPTKSSTYNLVRFKRALYRGDTREAMEIAQEMGLNYDDFASRKYTKNFRKAKVFSLSKKEIDEIYFGNKYRYPIVKGKKVKGYVCVSNVDKSVSFLRRPNESHNKRTVYFVEGCVCPQDWTVDDPRKIKVTNIAQFLDGEKFQIHKVVESKMKVYKKRQKDKGFVVETKKVLSEVPKGKLNKAKEV